MEIVLALAIIVIMTAIVYASLNSVVNSTAMARAAAEETRLRQFLTRSFEDNFRSVYMDRTSEQSAFQFIGVNDESRDGPMDSVRFCSSAPLMGGMSLPGDIKEVRYEVIKSEDSKMSLDLDDEDESEESSESAMLEASEMPLLAGNVDPLEDSRDGLNSMGGLSNQGGLNNRSGLNNRGGLGEELDERTMDAGYEAPHWSVPVRSMDILYFDGTEWLDEWDSLQFGRVPWCVHIRINFAKTGQQLKEEASKRYDEIDDPDFEVVIPIPAGAGVTQDGRSLPNFSGQAARDALQQLEAETAGRTGDARDSDNNIQPEGSNQ